MQFSHAIKTLFAYFLLSSNMLSGQCGVQSLPYENTFVDPTKNSCWITTDGNSNAIFYLDRGYLTPNNGPCISILRSPQVYIDKPFRLNYGIWHHRNGNYGSTDSVAVQYRNVHGGLWQTLKAYPRGFYTTSGSSLWVRMQAEEFEFDSRFVGDTLMFRFVYVNNPSPYYATHSAAIDAFRLEPIPDSVYAIPFYENFDSAPWSPASGSFYHQVYTTDPNWWLNPWNSPDVNVFKWLVQSGPTTTSNTGPTSDYSGSGNYIFTEGNFMGDYAVIETPLLDFDTIDYPTLSFAYFMYGQNLGSLQIDQWIDSNWTSLATITGQQQQANDPWKFFEISLDSGEISKIRFKINSNNIPSTNTYLDAALDEIHIFNSTCPIPRDFGLRLYSRTDTSLQMTSSISGLATGYRIEYGPHQFQQGNGIIDTVQSLPFTVENLSQNTNYDFYIQILCSSTDSTLVYGPYTFKTNCTPIYAPYSETFDGSGIPSCWTSPNPTTDSLYTGAWKIAFPTGNFPAYGAQNQVDHTGNNGHCIGVDGSVPFLNHVELYSPSFNVSSIRRPALEFWLYSNNTSQPGDNNLFYLDYFDGENWHNDVITYRGDSLNWIKMKYALPHDSIKGLVQFRFSVDKDANTPFYNDILIDDVKIIDNYTATCPLPSQVQAVRQGCNNIVLSWISDSSIVTSRIVYGLKGFDPFSSGTRIDGASSPALIKGIPLNDSVEIFIVDSCSAGLGVTSIATSIDSIYIRPSMSVSQVYRGNTDTTVTYLFTVTTSGTDSVHWTFGNSTTLVGDSVLYTFDSAQTVQITVSAFSVCGNGTYSFVIVIDNISIQETTFHPDFIVFPNPGNDILNILMNGGNSPVIYCSLINISGMQVLEKHLELSDENGYPPLDISELPNGLYILEIDNGFGMKHIEKVLIQH